MRGRWAGVAYKSATVDPPFLVKNECDSLQFDNQPILMTEVVSWEQ